MYLFIINNYYLKELFLQISYYALQFSQVKFFSFCVLHQTNIIFPMITDLICIEEYLFIFFIVLKLKSSIGKKRKKENEFSLSLLFIDNNCKV
jgi:hypothetical protein